MNRANNRDLPDLLDVLPVMREVESLERRREWQKERQVNITSHLSWTHGGSAPGGLETAFAILSELEEKHREKVAEYAKALKRAERILNGIEDSGMQAFVEMVYVCQCPRNEVLDALNMTEWGYRSARNDIEKAESMEAVVWRSRFYFSKE